MSADYVAFSGSIPEKYDSCLGPLLFEPYAIDLYKRIEQLPGKKILEIACGTGRVTKHLASKIQGASITATDLNADMITVARKRVGQETIEWKVADAQDLPFPNDSFDIVVCQFGFMFVPDKLKAFAEVFRVLKESGHFIFNTWDKIDYNGPVHAAYEIVNDFFKGDPPTFYEVPFSMYDKNEIINLLTHIGFNNISIEIIKKEGIADSAREAAVGFIEGNPVLIEIMNKDKDSVVPIENALTSKLIEKFGDQPMKGPLSALVSMATK